MVGVLGTIWGMILGSFWVSYSRSGELYRTEYGVAGLPAGVVTSVMIRTNSEETAHAVDPSSATVFVKSDWLMEQHRGAIVDAYGTVLAMLTGVSLVVYFLNRRNRGCEPVDGKGLGSAGASPSPSS